MKTLDDLRELMKARGLERLVEHAEKLAMPSIRLVLGPKDWEQDKLDVLGKAHNSEAWVCTYPFPEESYPTDSTSIGFSKIGGLPDLPPDFDWPENLGTALPFLAQIQLGEVVPLDEESILPSNGMLYFFYAFDETYIGDATRGEACRVIHYNGDLSRLSRQLFPDNIKRHEIDENLIRDMPGLNLPYITPMPIQFWRELDIAGSEAFEFCKLAEELGLSEEEQEAWWQITLEWWSENEKIAHQKLQERELHEMESPSHRMLGFPYCGNYDGREAYNVEGDPTEWLLLFQLSSEGPLGWGNEAATSFFIRRDDLKALNFSNVYVTYDR